MNWQSFILSRSLLIIFGLTSSVVAANTAGTSAKDLAAELAARQEGSAYVRLRFEVNGTAKETLQLQVKQRRTKTGTDIVYQVLWPKERKGESVLLHQAEGHAIRGTHFTPPDNLQSLSASQLNQPIFDSALSYADVIEDPFSWPDQSVTGTETLNGVNCTVLESKPGNGESIYGKVVSWIDTNRLVPMRIEKYLPGGQLAVRIDSTHISTDDQGRPIPAYLSVHDPRKGSATEVDGSRIKHNVEFADREFTPEGLKEISTQNNTTE
jgi:Outer membrane lipoprotein-sorting protein